MGILPVDSLGFLKFDDKLEAYPTFINRLLATMSTLQPKAARHYWLLIPNARMRDINVVGLSPSRSAAPPSP